MATASPVNQSAGVVNFASGKIDPSVNEAYSIALGFVPRYVKAFNEDTLEIYEKFEGMPAASTLKQINHADTQVVLDGTSDIVINTDGTITFSAALVATGDCIYWFAMG